MSFTRTRTRMTYLQCLNSLSWMVDESGEHFNVAQGYFGHLILAFVHLKRGTSTHLGGEYVRRGRLIEWRNNAQAELVDLLCRNMLGKHYW